MGEIDNKIEEITKLSSYTVKNKEKLVTFVDGKFNADNLKNNLIRHFPSNIIPK